VARRIVLPLVRNGLLVVTALLFIIFWGEFIYAVTFLSSSGQQPVSVIILDQVGSTSTDWTRLLAIAVVTSVPVLAVFASTQRFLREGISTGAIK
jgi:multiple sugar transport system permease protein